jgi:hypothetical protein
MKFDWYFIKNSDNHVKLGIDWFKGGGQRFSTIRQLYIQEYFWYLRFLFFDRELTFSLHWGRKESNVKFKKEKK